MARNLADCIRKRMALNLVTASGCTQYGALSPISIWIPDFSFPLSKGKKKSGRGLRDAEPDVCHVCAVAYVACVARIALRAFVSP